MPTSTNERRALGNHVFSRFRLVRRLAGVVIVIGATHCLLVHASFSRQANQEVMKRKLVIAENLQLNSSGAGIGAILAVDPKKDAGITFFNLKSSSSLHVGNIVSPFVSLRSETGVGMNISILPPGYASIQLQSRLPVAELSLAVYEDDQPVAFWEDSHGARVNVFGAGASGDPAGISLFDKVGKLVLRLGRSSRMINMSLFDSQGHLRSILGQLAGKGPGFLLYDRALHPLIEFTEDPVGRPLIKVNDPVARESRTLK